MLAKVSLFQLRAEPVRASRADWHYSRLPCPSQHNGVACEMLQSVKLRHIGRSRSRHGGKKSRCGGRRRSRCLKKQRTSMCRPTVQYAILPSLRRLWVVAIRGCSGVPE